MSASANELMVSYGSSQNTLGGKIKTGIDKVSARRSVRLRECPLAEILSREFQRVDCIRLCLIEALRANTYSKGHCQTVRWITMAMCPRTAFKKIFFLFYTYKQCVSIPHIKYEFLKVTGKLLFRTMSRQTRRFPSLMSTSEYSG